MDAKIGDNWRIGAASISQSEVSVDALQTHVATVSLAAYAGGSVGPVALRSGGAWSWHNIDVASGFAGETEQAYLNGDTGQVFGEAAYRMQIGPGVTEPFAGLALTHVNTGSQEQGGVAPLQATSEDAAYSTLGLRLDALVAALREHPQLRVPQGPLHLDVLTKVSFGPPSRELDVANRDAAFAVSAMRHFPPPWTVEQIPGGYKIKDVTGQSLAGTHGKQRGRAFNYAREVFLALACVGSLVLGRGGIGCVF